MKMNFRFLYYFFIGICIFFSAYLTPLVADDIMYQMQYCHGFDSVNIGSCCEFATISSWFGNIWDVFGWHYQHENGRFLLSIPLRVFAGISHYWYACFITALFLLFLNYLWLFSGLDRNFKPIIFGIGIFVLLEKEAVFWLAGGINYLFPVTCTMFLASRFCCEKSQGYVLSRKMISFWLLLPLSILMAGGHEIISVPVCLLLCVYWLRKIWTERRLPVDGRLLLTIGWGIGTVIMFLSPVSPLYRASAGSSATFTYRILCLLGVLAHSSVGNPLFVIVLCWLAYWGWRCPNKISGRVFWLVILFGFLFIFTVFFGNTSSRTVWPLNVVVVMVFFALMNKTTGVYYRPYCLLSVTCSLGVCANTLFASILNFQKTTQQESELRYSRNNLCMMPGRADWIFGFMFDRSAGSGIVPLFHGKFGCGGLSRKYGLQYVAGLPKKEFDFLRGSGLLHSRHHLLHDWYASSDCNIIISKVKPGESYKPGDALSASVEYSGNAESLGRILERIILGNFSQYSGGVAVFETRNWWNATVRDFLYATVYRKLPLKGIVVQTDVGPCKVLWHNKNSDRSQITKIKLNK